MGCCLKRCLDRPSNKNQQKYKHSENQDKKNINNLKEKQKLDERPISSTIIPLGEMQQKGESNIQNNNSSQQNNSNQISIFSIGLNQLEESNIGLIQPKEIKQMKAKQIGNTNKNNNKQQNIDSEVHIQLKTSKRSDILNLKISSEWNGRQLKKYIFQRLNNEHQSQIHYKQLELDNDKKLKVYQIPKGKSLQLVQKLISFRMICGHFISRKSLFSLIRNTINKNQFKIRCPECMVWWGYQDCKDIATFTHLENQQFKKILNLNAIQLNASEIRKCYTCDKLMKDQKNSIKCTNAECLLLQMLMKKIKFYKLNEKGKEKQFQIPAARACPHCEYIMEHEPRCKTMKCLKCKKEFCWICMSSKEEQPFQFENCQKYQDTFCGKLAK